MKRTIEGSVIVITGASSGIGRATALEFAEEGAHCVLAARDADALVEVARLCDQRGAEAIAVPTDVTDEAAVEALAQAASDKFGRIDVWVNDAAVYMMGTLESVPTEAFRQIFEVNVMGTVLGARAALARFRQQGSGVLINVGSMAGKVAYAKAAAYCATKHAIHALTEALRQELVGTDIHACIVAPATVDTPLFQHAANFTGQEIRAMHPIQSPERVARAIVSCAQRPRREVLVGVTPRAVTALERLAPAVFERIEPLLVNADHLGREHRQSSAGGLYGPVGPHAVSGGWKRARRPGALAAVGLVAAALPLLVLASRSGVAKKAAAALGSPKTRRALFRAVQKLAA